MSEIQAKFTINAPKSYTFGEGLKVTEKEVSLKTATSEDLGGVRVGGHLNIVNGFLSVNSASSAEAGVIRIATDAEFSEGTSESIAVNPKQINEALSFKQDNILDLQIIRDNAALAVTALQPAMDISLLQNNVGYLTSQDISTVMDYKGTKERVADLPITGNKVGDVWNIRSNGADYAWNGSEWNELGRTIDLSGYVPVTRTINEKPLSSDVVLTSADIGAQPLLTAGDNIAIEDNVISVKMVALTQAEYDLLASPDEDTYYMIISEV